MAAGQKKAKKDASVLVDEAQQRRERITLSLFFVGGVAIVLGMIVLSNFLSSGSDKVMENQPVLYGFVILSVLTAAGILYQILTKRKA